jgi:hypothetical protein
MNQKQTHQCLYIVGFFALLSLASIILTTPYVWRLVVMFPGILIISIIGDALLIFLVLAPFYKKNIVLLLVPILSYLMDLPSSIEGIYGFFAGTDILVNEGIVPGLFIYSIYVLTCLSGLIILALRCYGYIQEHRSGFKTKF